MADVGSRCRFAAWWKPDAECMDVVVEYTTCPRHNASSDKITRSKPLWFLPHLRLHDSCFAAVLPTSYLSLLNRLSLLRSLRLLHRCSYHHPAVPPSSVPPRSSPDPTPLVLSSALLLC